MCKPSKLLHHITNNSNNIVRDLRVLHEYEV